MASDHRRPTRAREQCAGNEDAPVLEHRGVSDLVARPGRAAQTPTMKLQLVVPLPPMFSVWKFLAPSTW